MFSVIIPTIWRSPYIKDIVEYLNLHTSVGEIIILDNDILHSKDFSYLQKVRHIKNPSNNYVSPSWNQGYELASYEKLCILNDDVLIHEDILTLMDNFISREVGLVGLSSSVYEGVKEHIDELKRPSELTIKPCTNRNFGYGCCMFIHKDNYVKIPTEMKIQYGDDYIFYNQKKINYVLDGFDIVGKISASLLDENLQTINKDIINSICQNDHTIFWEKMNQVIDNHSLHSNYDKDRHQSLEYYKWKSTTNYYFK
jgi:hypothetical protein